MTTPRTRPRATSRAATCSMAGRSCTTATTPPISRRASSATRSRSARCFGDREWALYVAAAAARRPLAHSPRSYVGRPEVTHRACRIPWGLLLVVALVGCSSSGDGMIALEGATLIDGSGGDPIKDALVLVQHGHIQAVARVNEIPVPRGSQVVNLIGKTIIPGLIDAHRP